MRTVAASTATDTYGARYVFSDLDLTQVSMATRVNWVLTPQVSLQVYAQPLPAAGDYWGFKHLTSPGTFDFLRYGERGSAIAHDPSRRVYEIDPDGAGPRSVRAGPRRARALRRAGR